MGKISAILAHDKNFGIGYEDGLPWGKVKEDMQLFRMHTLGKVVIMGRKTWESIGSKPLLDRANVVISRDKDYIDGLNKIGISDLYAFCSTNIGATLLEISDLFGDIELVVIGGAELYNSTAPYIEELKVTKFNKEFECDTFIDPDKLYNGMKLVYSLDSNENDFSFNLYGRI
jgi:dihydrofolate reductase